MRNVTDYFLNFTNLSGRRCTLHGYPGVSGVNLAGAQLGSAASRVGVTPHTVTLANGAIAHGLVGIVDPGVIPASKCGPVAGAGLRVHPPNQIQPRVAPFPFTACSKRGRSLSPSAPRASPNNGPPDRANVCGQGAN